MYLNAIEDKIDYCNANRNTDNTAYIRILFFLHLVNHSIVENVSSV